MYHYESPITQKSFPHVWDLACRKNYWFRKKHLFRPAVNILSQFLFLQVFLTLVLGFVQKKAQPLWQFLTEHSRFAGPYWAAVAQHFYGPGQTELQNLLTAAFSLFVLPLLSALLPALLVLIFYHPRKPGLDPDPSLQPDDLKKVSDDLRKYQPGAGNFPYTLARNVYLLFTGGILLVFILRCSKTGGFLFLLDKSRLETMVVLVLYWILFYLIYEICNLPVRRLSAALYRDRMPTFFFRDVDAYYDAALRGTAPTGEADPENPPHFVP